MKSLNLRAFSLAFACAYVGIANDASAFGNQGHQTIGAMADTLLSGTNAEQQVKALLKTPETLSSVAIWAG